MKLSNNGDKFQLDISCHQVKLQSWDWVISNWVVDQSGPMEIPKQPRPGCHHDYRLFYTNWQQGLIVEDNMYTIHWTWRSWGWSVHRTFTHYVLFSWVQEDILHATKREMHTPTELQTLWSTMVSCLQDILAQWWHSACGRHRPLSYLT